MLVFLWRENKEVYLFPGLLLIDTLLTFQLKLILSLQTGQIKAGSKDSEVHLHYHARQVSAVQTLFFLNYAVFNLKYPHWTRNVIILFLLKCDFSWRQNRFVSLCGLQPKSH